MSETQGGNDGAQLGPVAGLDGVVAPRTLLLQSVGYHARLALSTQPLEKGPTRLWIGLAVVEACPVSHEDERGTVVGQGASETTDCELAEHEKVGDEEAKAFHLIMFIKWTLPRNSSIGGRWLMGG